MATPISSSRPSRTVSTGASAAIGWSARADAVLGSSTVRIRKTVAHGGRRESMKRSERARTTPLPPMRATDGRSSEFTDALPRESYANCTRSRAGRPGAWALRPTCSFSAFFRAVSGETGLTGVWLGVLLLGLAGCGAMQSTPDNPTGAGGLMPNVEDKDAGLVAVAPGFNISRYKGIVVEPFPVTDPPSKDEGDRQFAAKMAGFLQLELVRRLKASGLFPTVVNGSQTQYKPGAQPALRLQGAITRLGRGSQVARYFAGLYG